MRLLISGGGLLILFVILCMGGGSLKQIATIRCFGMKAFLSSRDFLWEEEALSKSQL
jgi:hypothetical protein